MKVLVLGASSFSGRAFAHYLTDAGFDVFHGSLRHWNLPKRMDPDYVVNFAAANVVAPSWNYPGLYVRTNVIETTRFFDWMLEQQGTIRKYVHVSTPEVYGNVTGRITEDHPFDPSTPYAVSRAAAEYMARCYQRNYGLPVCFTRACNVYGPGQQLHRLVPKVIHSVLSGRKFPLEGGGVSKRAFIHIDDLCAATKLVMEQGEIGQAYHISGQYLFPIRDLVSVICELCGVKFIDTVQLAPERPGKDACYHLDDSKLRALGWTDRVSIEDGIRSVWQWMTDQWGVLKNQPTTYEVEP